MIIETIVSTIDNDGKVNFSPFGIKKIKIRSTFHLTFPQKPY